MSLSADEEPLSARAVLMRVAMYYRNSDVRLEEMPRPTIGEGEMLVRAMASGICGSDVMEWYRMKKAPRVLGHEMTGEVVEVGPGVEAFRPGDRVFVSHHIPCNTCRYCLTGHATACETLHTTNYDPGGFAEYIRVPRLNVDRGSFPLPDGMSYDLGTWIEPLGCVVRGQRRLQTAPGDTVLILGSGISGLTHLATSRAFGAGRVLATDVEPRRLEAAKRVGADGTIAADDDVPARVRELNDGRLADRVVVCTGAAAAARQALQAVERGGCLLFFAVPTDDIQVPINDFWRNDVTIRTSYGAAPTDILQAIGLLQAGVLPAEEMITHRLPLAETQKGFELVAEARDSIKVIIHPQD